MYLSQNSNERFPRQGNSVAEANFWDRLFVEPARCRAVLPSGCFPHMPRSFKAINPFYFLLVLIGPVFVVSVVAYVLMMLHLNGSRGLSLTPSQTDEHPIVRLFRDHGNAILGGELAVLALLTLGAIATDKLWQARSKRAASQTPSVDSDPAATP